MRELFSSKNVKKFFVFGMVALVACVALAGIEGQSSSSLNLPNTPYAALFACGEKMSEVPLAFVSNEEFDVIPLASDEFSILEKTNNTLYLYTPFYAGVAQLEIDESGKPISLAKPDQWLQYNIQIPHLSTKSPGKGVFYMTVNDLPYAGHHDSRVNYPPRFLPGDSQVHPDFSKVKSAGSITITSYPIIPDEFHPLTIADEIWSSHTLSSEATTTLAMIIANSISDLYLRIHSCESSVGNGCPSSTQLDRRYSAILATCEAAGQKMHNQSILSAIVAARKNAEAKPDSGNPGR